jgi:hypothetical protein
MIPTQAATYVEGPITHDTVWTLVDSPFVVSKDVTVYSNATLTIEPGVEVKFGGNFSLLIWGKLYANGTGNTITFTSNKEQPAVGDWNSIGFYGPQKSTLVGCSIQYASDAILIQNGNVEIVSSSVSLSQNAITAINGDLKIQNCIVSLSSYNGINITDSQSTVTDSIITENQESGICITGNEQVTIQNNSILANGNGVSLTGDEASNLNVSQNIISANMQNGISIDASILSNNAILENSVSSNYRGFYVYTLESTQITNNSISYNSIGFLYDLGNHVAKWNDIYSNEMGMDVSNATVVAEYNYWGDPSGPYHEMLNPNGRGDPVGGDGVNLDFITFLTKPVGVVNQRPTASLTADKLWPAQNDNVMFFGTNSYDVDGRVDRYYFDFGDGDNSGWTTLSTFSHEYSSTGAYPTSLRVMDDYGAVSNVAPLTINVVSGTLPSLRVSLTLSNSTVNEGGQVSVTVYVTNGTAPVQNANVTLLSMKGGTFTQSSALTNASGYFVTTFTAPDETEVANVRIVARASRSGAQYADGSDHKYLQVLPFLSVQVTANPYVIKSEGTTQVTVHVESSGQPVENASVTVSSDVGSLLPETGYTDHNGVFSLVFTAPLTTTSLSVNVTAVATKDEYLQGTGQTAITVEPKVPDVTITTTPTTTISEAQLNVTVHVEYETIPLVGANVTITADDGNFTKATELTDNYGNVTFLFTAPPVNEQTNVTITAYATIHGFAEGQNRLEITVNPRTFDIQIIASEVESGKATSITVSVTCKEDGSAVPGATVSISSNYGTFDSATKTTDSTGTCVFVFYAPQTASDLLVNITANVAKNGYIDGVGQATATVTKVTSQGEGGFPWLIVLLIAIPVAIALIVVALIKLKIIVISGEEET